MFTETTLRKLMPKRGNNATSYILCEQGHYKILFWANMIRSLFGHQGCNVHCSQCLNDRIDLPNINICLLVRFFRVDFLTHLDFPEYPFSTRRVWKNMEEKKKESFNIEEDDNRIICHLNFVGELVTNMTIKKFFLIFLNKFHHSKMGQED